MNKEGVHPRQNVSPMQELKLNIHYKRQEPPTVKIIIITLSYATNKKRQRKNPLKKTPQLHQSRLFVPNKARDWLLMARFAGKKRAPPFFLGAIKSAPKLTPSQLRNEENAVPFFLSRKLSPPSFLPPPQIGRR